MEEKKPKGFINKLHLIYIIICLGIAILAILTITIWHDENAGVGLNNAATASSIVLAVVAIVMTIVDVAGQRNTVADLKETAEKLRENLLNANLGIENISRLEEQLVNSMNLMQKSYDEIVKGIGNLLEKYEDDGTDNSTKETKVEIVKDLVQLKDKIKPMNFIFHFDEKDIPSSKHNKNDIVILYDFIINVLSDGGEYNLKDIMLKANKSNIRVSFSRINTILTMLHHTGVVEKDSDGHYRLRSE